MSKFIIRGGKKLSGTVRPSGNKNEVLPALMACLLTKEMVRLRNVPRIGDVMTVCAILENLGVKVHWEAEDVLCLEASQLHSHKPDAGMCAKVRASILLIGPLLARLGKVELALPGGDVIGARRIDTHWEGATALGASLELRDKIYGSVKGGRLKGAELFLDEPSVTATENLLLMAALAEGTTVLHNAACEPHVVGLARLLKKMGVAIKGEGTNRLEIIGTAKAGGADHTITSDFMEVGSFACLAAATGSKIKIENVSVEDYRFILKIFHRLGIEVEAQCDAFIVDGSKARPIQNDIGGRVPTIYSGPWPAFPTDLMSVAIVAATQRQGTVIFFEKMFEGRMFFTDKLIAMGATIILCDPHRIVVNGPARLFPADMSSPDVRAGMALLIASLIADGTSTINNIYQIERGYYRIEEKLKALGADIVKEGV